jgi:hypothetical protein
MKRVQEYRMMAEGLSAPAQAPRQTYAAPSQGCYQNNAAGAFAAGFNGGSVCQPQQPVQVQMAPRSCSTVGNMTNCW